MNYYNENNPEAAAWLRELIKAGEIPDGFVDTRSIEEVKPHELTQYTQQHFFAGIGGWALALRLAGWPDDEPACSASCPCQPLSCAGQGKGHADERHLWPAFYNIVAERKPAIIFGEQVASPLGREWLSGIRADLEGIGYAVGASDLSAAGVGAPHTRQRLYWVANSQHPQRRPLDVYRKNERNGQDIGREKTHRKSGARSEVLRLGHAQGEGRTGMESELQKGISERSWAGGSGAIERLGNADQERCDGERVYVWRGGSQQGGIEASWSSEDIWNFGKSAWSRFSITPCLDGTLRRFEPGSFPLAHGVPGRVGLLRGYGNAIVPPLAAEFIQAAEEARILVASGV